MFYTLSNRRTALQNLAALVMLPFVGGCDSTPNPTPEPVRKLPGTREDVDQAIRECPDLQLAEKIIGHKGTFIVISDRHTPEVHERTVRVVDYLAKRLPVSQLGLEGFDVTPYGESEIAALKSIAAELGRKGDLTVNRQHSTLINRFCSASAIQPFNVFGLEANPRQFRLQKLYYEWLNYLGNRPLMHYPGTYFYSVNGQPTSGFEDFQKIANLIRKDSPDFPRFEKLLTSTQVGDVKVEVYNPRLNPRSQEAFELQLRRWHKKEILSGRNLPAAQRAVDKMKPTGNKFEIGIIVIGAEHTAKGVIGIDDELRKSEEIVTIQECLHQKGFSVFVVDPIGTPRREGGFLIGEK